MRNPAFCICDWCRFAQVIDAFVFATLIEQSLCFLNPKFQASSHILWLYSPASVGPGKKHRRLVFWRQGLFMGVYCFKMSEFAKLH